MINFRFCFSQFLYSLKGFFINYGLVRITDVILCLFSTVDFLLER